MGAKLQEWEFRGRCGYHVREFEVVTAQDPPTVAEGAGSVALGPLADLTGSTLAGKYLIVRKIGAGSMGDVYEATQLSTGMRVAVKVLKAERAVKDVFRHRFLREAKSSVMVDHPSVVNVLDYGEDAHGLLYYAMEFLEGEDLRQLIERHGALPWPYAQAILVEAAGALAAAHDAGIIHRDIKPSNILLVRTADGGQLVKLIDFGVAKLDNQLVSRVLTQAADVVGTVLYMSPEQAEGYSADERSDIYTFGVTAYELCTGVVPFPGQDIFKVMAAHMNGIPTPPNQVIGGLPDAANDFVLRCLEKAPEARYQSMHDVVAVLDGSADPMADSAPRPDSRTRQPSDRHRPIGLDTNAGFGPDEINGPGPAPQFETPGPSSTGDDFEDAPTAYFQVAKPSARGATIVPVRPQTPQAQTPRVEAPPLGVAQVITERSPLAPPVSPFATEPSPVLDIPRGATVRVQSLPPEYFAPPDPPVRNNDAFAPIVVSALIIGVLAVLGALAYVVVT